MLRIQRHEANSVNPDKVAYDELSHLDLHCFQIQPFSFLALLKLLMIIYCNISNIIYIFSCIFL